MYVCLCQNVTDSAIRRELDAGAGSFAEVRERLGVASQCGSCELLARGIVSEHLTNATASFYNADLDYSAASVA